MASVQGHIRFNRVGLRYLQDQEAALQNINFDIAPGEFVAVCGRNGSGKSSVLKLLLGLYAPQSGNIFLDEQDLRQFDVLDLRNAMAYVPQHGQLFYGTVEQNLRLVKPNATEEALQEALRKADLLEEVDAMPEGLHAPMGSQTTQKFSSSFMQRFALARAYLKQPKILLFDEPAASLDQKGEQALLNAIAYFKGKTTIIMVTHRPSHFKLADKILLFHQGQLLLAGPTAQVLPRMPKEFLP